MRSQIELAKDWWKIALVALVAGALGLIYFVTTPVVVQCPADLFENKDVVWTLRTLNAVTNKVVPNIYLYVFSEKPEDFGKYEQVTSLKGLADFSVETTVEGANINTKTGKVLYILGDALEFYPVFATINIPVPRPPVRVEQQLKEDMNYIRTLCIKEYGRIEDALSAAGVQPISEIKVDPLAVPKVSPRDYVLGVYIAQESTEVDELTDVDYAVIVPAKDSVYLLDKVIFERGPDFGEVQYLEVVIKTPVGTQNFVLYDATGDTVKGLLSERTTYEATNITNVDVVRVTETGRIEIYVKIKASTELTAVAGNGVLGPGEIPLYIRLVDADYEELAPIELRVQARSA